MSFNLIRTRWGEGLGQVKKWPKRGKSGDRWASCRCAWPIIHREQGWHATKERWHRKPIFRVEIDEEKPPRDQLLSALFTRHDFYLLLHTVYMTGSHRRKWIWQFQSFPLPKNGQQMFLGSNSQSTKITKKKNETTNVIAAAARKTAVCFFRFFVLCFSLPFCFVKHLILVVEVVKIIFIAWGKWVVLSFEA